MYLPATYYALPLFLGSALSIALVILGWQRRQEAGAKAFMVSMLALALWSLAYANEVVSVELSIKILWHKLAYTSIPLVVTCWLLFLLQQRKHPRHFIRIVGLLLMIEPLLFIFLTWTNDRYHLLWHQITLGTDAGLPYLNITRAIGFYVHTGYAYLLMLTATFLMLRLLWRKSSLSHVQAVAGTLAALTPILINFLYLLGINPVRPLDLTPFGLVTFGTAAGWFIFRFQFWELLPAARHAIVENMNDGIIVLNKHNWVVDINPSACRLLSLPLHGSLGQPITEIMHSCINLQTLQTLLDGSDTVPPQSVEVMLLNSQTRFVDLAVSTMYSRNRQVAGRLLTLHDVTQRKLVEQALADERNTLSRRVEERTTDLSEANAQLARAARLKDEFLASMSHELRTPLNTVLGLSEALQEQVYGELTPKQRKALHSIEESGRHLLALINDILDVSKIEAGQLALDIQPVSVEAVCHASLSFIRQLALKKQITITTQIASDTTMLEADERRLKQILVNLLSNAVKFTPEAGKIGLQVSGNVAEEVIRFTVWDNGIGIAPVNMPRLFQPFVQLDSSFSRQHEGTGLGLVLAYRMVEMHGGSISVDSELGAGSRFTISLPWHPQLMHASPALRSPTPKRHCRSMRHALVVDHAQSKADQTAHLLRNLGIDAEICTNTDDIAGLAHWLRPDVILLDLLLPERAGWDILSELRADEQMRLIPVIMISLMATAPPAHLVSSPSLGSVHVLLKPFAREELSVALAALSFREVGRLQASQAGTKRALALKPALYPQTILPTILLVEDNETTIMIFSDYLQVSGYRIQVARNGHEAMAHLAETIPDLVLLDIQMPGMDGLEVMCLIRNAENLQQLPIIAVTALAMPGDQERCLAAGANAYLSKPVSLKILLNTIVTILKRG